MRDKSFIEILATIIIIATIILMIVGGIR